MKIKILLPILLLPFFVALTPTKAYAYWEIFGIKVPTNISEIRETIKFKNPFNNKVDEEVKIEDAKDSIEAKELSEEENKDLQLIKMSEKDVNSVIDKYIEGSEYYGIKVNQLNIELLENTVNAQGKTNDDTDVNLSFKLIEDGTKIEIQDINISNSKNSFIQEMALKVAVEQMQSKLIGQYLKGFRYAKVEKGTISVYYNSGGGELKYDR